MVLARRSARESDPTAWEAGNMGPAQPDLVDLAPLLADRADHGVEQLPRAAIGLVHRFLAGDALLADLGAPGIDQHPEPLAERIRHLRAP
jgi:hypothetical protein